MDNARLIKKMAEYSDSLFPFRLTMAEVKPLSIKITLSNVNMLKAPINPKSFGESIRAVKIPTKRAIIWNPALSVIFQIKELIVFFLNVSDILQK